MHKDITHTIDEFIISLNDTITRTQFNYMANKMFTDTFIIYWSQ